MTRRCSFTLLELMLCIAILALLSGFLGWQTKELVETSRFEKGVGRLANALRQLQVTALGYQTDLAVKLFKDGSEFVVELGQEEPIKVLERFEKIHLKNITLLEWNQKPKDQLELKIYSSGRIEPKGVLGFTRIISEEKTKELFIDLQSPLQIKVSPVYPKVREDRIPPKPAIS